ncbi:hypothetical protein [Spongiibacter marinus]|uniref:hypothetical protein n=1 Tax=Spongiibacter marinus TaxID=354246 RepID=UPI0012B55960|nr:hypothetical protein [Spongiibacter marinus]
MNKTFRGASRNYLLAGIALALVAVFATPNHAQADNADVAAAVLLGAAVVYAAHDSDVRYVHRHHAHCGHAVVKHPNRRHGYRHAYRSGYRDGYDDGAYHYSRPHYGKYHHKRDYWRHHNSRYDRHPHKGGYRPHKGLRVHGKGNDWNTRVIIREY